MAKKSSYNILSDYWDIKHRIQVFNETKHHFSDGAVSRMRDQIVAAIETLPNEDQRYILTKKLNER